MKKYFYLLFSIAIMCSLFSGCVREKGCETYEYHYYGEGVLIALDKPKKWVQESGYHVVQTAYYVPGNPSEGLLDSIMSGALNSNHYHIIEGAVPKKYKRNVPYRVEVVLKCSVCYYSMYSKTDNRNESTFRLSCIEEL